MNVSPDHYTSVATPATGSVTEKGSRFLGDAAPVQSTEAIEHHLQSIRKRYYDASHHCFAWRMGVNGEQFKYSDDGEPSGTGGRPIFELLCGRGLTNSLVVVTRYFGGTKLGTGPLARAYADAAAAALDRAGKREWLVTKPVEMTFEISLYDRWLRLMRQLDLPGGSPLFSSQVTVTCDIRLGMIEPLRAAFTELTLGKGTFTIA